MDSQLSAYGDSERAKRERSSDLTPWIDPEDRLTPTALSYTPHPSFDLKPIYYHIVPARWGSMAGFTFHIVHEPQPAGVLWYDEQGAREGVGEHLAFMVKYWDDQLRQPGGIRIAGYHYRLGDENARGRGHGGRYFRIRMLDTGRVIESTNLWGQGRIPNWMRPKMPDNAVMMGD